MPVTKSRPSRYRAEDVGYLKAAQNLIKEVQEEYFHLLRERRALAEIIEKWRRLLAAFRRFEKVSLLERKPSATTLALHRKVMNLMILCAGNIAITGDLHLSENHHLQNGERTDLLEKVELVKRHKKLLTFELGHWHGPSPTKKQIEAAEREVNVGHGKAP
jgi:hypothetical protein